MQNSQLYKTRFTLTDHFVEMFGNQINDIRGFDASEQSCNE